MGGRGPGGSAAEAGRPNFFFVIPGQIGRRTDRKGGEGRLSEGDDPKVFEAKIQVVMIFTWAPSLSIEYIV